MRWTRPPFWLAGVLAVLLILGAVIRPSAPAVAAGDCTATPSALSDPLTAGVWQQLNQSRASFGLPAYSWSPALAQAAAWMAHDAVRLQGAVPTTDVDSLGRDARTRDTDCGYRSDAQVREGADRFWTAYAQNIWTIWVPNDLSTWWIEHSSAGFPPVYTVGALGRAHDAASGADYWVLDVGTLPDVGGAPTATPTARPTATAAATATLVLPTATPVPTMVPTPVPTDDPYPVHRVCVFPEGTGGNPVPMDCDSWAPGTGRG